MTEPHPTTPTRVAIIIDIHTTPTIAHTLAHARLAEIITTLRRHGINANPIRIDIHSYPNPNP